jgi:hypothetical protein
MFLRADRHFDRERGRVALVRLFSGTTPGLRLYAFHERDSSIQCGDAGYGLIETWLLQKRGSQSANAVTMADKDAIAPIRWSSGDAA